MKTMLRRTAPIAAASLMLSLLSMGYAHAQNDIEEDEGTDIHQTAISAANSPAFVTPDGIRHPLLPYADFEAGIFRAKALLKANGNVTSQGSLHMLITPPASFSLAGYQTPIRNQQDRGSCWAFCSVAGMEAAYRHHYGVSLDLSEQYAFSMGKCSELYPDYATNTVPHENNSSYYGNQGNSGFINNLMRIALPLEGFAPYLNQAQVNAISTAVGAGDLTLPAANQEQYDAFEYSETNIPRAARANARYFVTGTATLVAVNNRELEKMVSSGHEVEIDINFKAKWDAAKNAYDYDPTAGDAGHCMLVVGYDRPNQIFVVKNSWGGTTLTRFTYNFMSHNLEWGNYITNVSSPSNPPQIKAGWVGSWNMDHDGWRGKLVIRRFTNPRASSEWAATKLGNYYTGGKRYDVNGYFFQGGRGMAFYVADHEGRIVPGTLTGQGYAGYIFSWDPSNAAGYTTWNWTPYGLLLSRDTPPGTYANASSMNVSSWMGTWNMNHDGWRGTLYLTAYSWTGSNYRVTGWYKNSGGSWFFVTGYVQNGTQHVMSMTIPFSSTNNQKFDIMLHTWENGVFSGRTYWGGDTFGVQGFK